MKLSKTERNYSNVCESDQNQVERDQTVLNMSGKGVLKPAYKYEDSETGKSLSIQTARRQHLQQLSLPRAPVIQGQVPHPRSSGPTSKVQGQHPRSNPRSKVKDHQGAKVRSSFLKLSFLLSSFLKINFFSFDFLRLVYWNFCFLKFSFLKFSFLKLKFFLSWVSWIPDSWSSVSWYQVFRCGFFEVKFLYTRFLWFEFLNLMFLNSSARTWDASQRQDRRLPDRNCATRQGAGPQPLRPSSARWQDMDHQGFPGCVQAQHLQPCTC